MQQDQVAIKESKRVQDLIVAPPLLNKRGTAVRTRRAVTSDKGPTKMARTAEFLAEATTKRGRGRDQTQAAGLSLLENHSMPGALPVVETAMAVSDQIPQGAASLNSHRLFMGNHNQGLLNDPSVIQSMRSNQFGSLNAGRVVDKALAQIKSNQLAPNGMRKGYTGNNQQVLQTG